MMDVMLVRRSPKRDLAADHRVQSRMNDKLVQLTDQHEVPHRPRAYLTCLEDDTSHDERGSDASHHPLQWVRIDVLDGKLAAPACSARQDRATRETTSSATTLPMPDAARPRGVNGVFIAPRIRWCVSPSWPSSASPIIVGASSFRIRV